MFNTIGNSMAASPYGLLAKIDNDKPGVLRTELKKKDLDTVRKYFYLLENRNKEMMKINQ